MAGVQKHKIRERNQSGCDKLAGGEGKRAVGVPGGWMTRQVGGEGRGTAGAPERCLKTTKSRM